VAEALPLRPKPIEKTTKAQTPSGTDPFVATLFAPEVPITDPDPGFFRLHRFFRASCSLAQAFDALERRCPDYVDAIRWQTAVKDGRRFLDQWVEQAQALGWSAHDVFGLHEPPERPDPSYQRLSRRDAIGLVWLLQGGSVTRLTADTAMVATERTGTVLAVRRCPVTTLAASRARTEGAAR
jgi:hypothetical protein